VGVPAIRGMGRLAGAAHGINYPDCSSGTHLCCDPSPALDIVVVHLVPVPMPFAHFVRAVDLLHARAGREPAGVRAEAHGAAEILHVALRVHQRHDRILALGRELAGVRLRQPADVTGELDDLIANDNAEGQYFVEVLPTDFALRVGCEVEVAG